MGQPGQGAHDSVSDHSLSPRGSILDQRGDGREPISFQGGGGTAHSTVELKTEEKESEGEESEYSTLDDGESQATAVHRPSLITSILAGDGKSNMKTPRSIIRNLTQSKVQLAESKDGADKAAAPRVQLAERKDGADKAAAPEMTTLHRRIDEKDNRSFLSL